MEKVALVGALLLQQVRKDFILFFLSNKTLNNQNDWLKLAGSVIYCLQLQVNWSSGCRSHVNLIKEEEKCMEELLRLNAQEATGEFSIKNAQLYLLCSLQLIIIENNSKLQIRKRFH